MQGMWEEQPHSKSLQILRLIKLRIHILEAKAGKSGGRYQKKGAK